MEEQWQVDRARLHRLRQEHPEWSNTRLTEESGRSLTWVKKWRKRFEESGSADETLFKSRSRCPKQAGSPLEPAVIERILDIRDNPPLHRVPGPLTIKYYLHKREESDPLNCYLPTSSSTIWRVLAEHQRIDHPKPADDPQPLEPGAPLQVWQIDFKDVTSVPADPEGKQSHMVESLNMVDTGTSLLVDNPAQPDFNAETVIRTLAGTLQQVGCPRQITFDRDPRFVARASSDGFPAPFVRFLACLGIKADICPPQRPDRNGYVERYNRTYKYEGILIYLPQTLEQVLDMNLDLKFHYNFERPNQARTCANQPPRLAFPQLPALAPVPDTIDPDRWLDTIHGHLFKRRVTANGTVQVDKHHYYIGRAHRGQLVVLQVDALNKQFGVELHNEVIKHIPIKGLYQGQLAFADYLEFICEQAISNWRLYQLKQRRYLPLAV